MSDTHGTSPAMTDSAADAAETARQQKLQRTLIFIVVGLGAAIVAGLIALVLRIMYLANTSDVPAASPALSTAAPWRLEMPKGAKIGSMAIGGSTLAVHYSGPAGDGIAIIDLTNGKRRAEILPVEAVPQN